MRPLVLLLVVATLPVGMVACVNATVDPFCFFGPSNSIVSRKYLYDERGQKTNYIVRTAQKYDGLLLGSSRTAYVDPSEFRSGTFFNYAASGILPFEYAGFIEVAKKRHNIKTVVIGFDFFATNAAEHPKEFKPARDYESAASYRNLLSYAGLKYSRVSVSCSVRKLCLERSYTTVFTRTWNAIAPEDRQERTRLHLEQYAKTYYGENYQFDPSFEQMLKKLKTDNPGVKLIGFTTPISQELFALLVERGLFPQYAAWLKMLTDNLDETYDFMGVNTVTRNPLNYLDAHHFSPQVGKYVARRIEGGRGEVPSDFGVRLDASTLSLHLCMVGRMRRGTVGVNANNMGTEKCLD